MNPFLTETAEQAKTVSQGQEPSFFLPIIAILVLLLVCWLIWLAIRYGD